MTHGGSWLGELASGARTRSAEEARGPQCGGRRPPSGKHQLQVLEEGRHGVVGSSVPCRRECALERVTDEMGWLMGAGNKELRVRNWHVIYVNVFCMQTDTGQNAGESGWGAFIVCRSYTHIAYRKS